MRGLEDRLYVADVTSANSRRARNLLPHIYMLSFRQICRTLALAPGSHVVECPLLEMGFQCQRHANADERIPSAPELMMNEYELQGFALTILNAVDALTTFLTSLTASAQSQRESCPSS